VLFAATCLSRTKANVMVTAIAIFVACSIGMMWRQLLLREALGRAVLEEDASTVRALLEAGVAGHRAHAPFRQELLLAAARAVNVDIVAAFVDGGTDLNAPTNGQHALMLAITSDAFYSTRVLDDETHRQRRVRTVAYLLDHGADPNLMAGGTTPAEAAWLRGSADIGALLKEKGAKDAETIRARWEELLRASAVGDLGQVERLVAESVGRHQRGPQQRAPLVEAARNGRVEVVDMLLEVYGDQIKCDLAEEGARVAEQQKHVDVASRLSRVCAPSR
jgi:ankyrin repeat protein